MDAAGWGAEMIQIAIVLGLAVALLFSGMKVVENLKDAGREEQAAADALEISRARDRAVADAVEHYRLTMLAIDAARRDRDKIIAETEATLEGLRNERATDADAGDVVFDSRYADWLRGRAAAPDARPSAGSGKPESPKRSTAGD
jgi:hypothetical protein